MMLILHPYLGLTKNWCHLQVKDEAYNEDCTTGDGVTSVWK